MFTYSAQKNVESKLINTPQGKIIFSLLDKPQTSKQLIDRVKIEVPDFKTKQPLERVVGFYLCVWKKEGSVIATKVEKPKVEKPKVEKPKVEKPVKK